MKSHPSPNRLVSIATYAVSVALLAFVGLTAYLASQGPDAAATAAASPTPTVPALQLNQPRQSLSTVTPTPTPLPGNRTNPFQ